ncbi:MAG: ATP-binding protein, partial [Dokdonella sp.]
MSAPSEAVTVEVRVLRRARSALMVITLLTVAAAATSPWLVRDPFMILVIAAWSLIALVALIAALASKADAHASLAASAPNSTLAGVPADALRELETLRTMQHELLAAKQSAEAATMAKGEFLATMSHEIRTPLNGIVPLLDLMLSTPLQSDQREYLVTAHRSALELLRIVDDILDYSKLEASKLELENVGINLKELVDSVAMLMESSATAKGLRLVVSIDPSVRLAERGDPARLRQVLTNLVSNAIKFTERGSVTIQLGKRGESLTHYETVFAVRDTGIGMSTETAAKLFQPFSQADASTTRLYGGTGLGLVICKRLVDLMGGKIGVRSELARGSLFWFNVPLQKAVGDVRVRRDLNGTRALLLGADETFVRRSSGLLANLGVSHIHATIAVDALTKLRSSATMGQRWGYEILLIDVESIRTSSAALVRNVLRDPGLDHMRILVAGNEDNTRDLTDGSRVAALAANFDERDLRAALHLLLGIDDSPVGRGAQMLDLDTFVGANEVRPAAPIRQLSGHVLLVEDNAVNLQVAKRLLGMFGIEVDSAEDGRIALDCLARARYDLILMDCQMPVMDGYAATRARRELESERGMPRLPIIAMTANAMVGDRQKCLDAG